MERAMLHLYHGDGKGKTTAATGLCVRAIGAGKRVLFVSFMKPGDSSELSVLKDLTSCELLLPETAFGFSWKMSKKEREAARKEQDRMLELIRKKIDTNGCDLLILDEVVSADGTELLDHGKLLRVLDEGKKNGVEIVLTGRDPAEDLLERADYSTQMRALRHPYEKGVGARKGIEW